MALRSATHSALLVLLIIQQLLLKNLTRPTRVQLLSGSGGAKAFSGDDADDASDGGSGSEEEMKLLGAVGSDDDDAGESDDGEARVCLCVCLCVCVGHHPASFGPPQPGPISVTPVPYDRQHVI